MTDFCGDCPDREGCGQGIPCEAARAVTDEERYAELGEQLRTSWAAACGMGLEGRERDAFMGQRAYGLGTSLYVERERERRHREKLKAAADAEWEVIGGGGWRFQPVVQGGGSSFKYNVVVQKSNWPAEGWEKVGTEYAMTKWGARRAAEKIRRRHMRRFPDR